MHSIWNVWTNISINHWKWRDVNSIHINLFKSKTFGQFLLPFFFGSLFFFVIQMFFKFLLLLSVCVTNETHINCLGMKKKGKIAMLNAQQYTKTFITRKMTICFQVYFRVQRVQWKLHCAVSRLEGNEVKKKKQQPNNGIWEYCSDMKQIV